MRKYASLVLLALLGCGGGGGGGAGFDWEGNWAMQLNAVGDSCSCERAGAFLNLPPLEVFQDGDEISAGICGGIRCLTRNYIFHGTAYEGAAGQEPYFVAETDVFYGCATDADTLAVAKITFTRETGMIAGVDLTVEGVKDGNACLSHYQGAAEMLGE